MSLKHLSVGFALAALTVVLVPTTGHADARGKFEARSHNVEQRKARIQASHAYREKFQDMRMKRFKHKKHYEGDDLVGVPELDPNGLGAAATLLLGGVLVAQGRRRRLLLA